MTMGNCSAGWEWDLGLTAAADNWPLGGAAVHTTRVRRVRPGSSRLLGHFPHEQGFGCMAGGPAG